MTRLRTTLGLALLLTGIGATIILPAQSRADVALREAIETETVKGDLRKALEQYRKLGDGRDRPVAAQALLRMGGIYELLRSAEAPKVYERILAQFKDQKDAVEKARARLRVFNAAPAALAHSRVWDVTTESPRQQDFAAGEGSVSSDGRFICFTASFDEGGSYRSYLAVRDLANGTDRILRNAPKADSGEGCSFSPTGDQIAYAWHEEPDKPNRWELRVVSLVENAAPRTLLQDSVKWYGTPAWSPDGRSIAVQEVEGNEREGRKQAILASVQDGTTRILSTPGSWRMFFSPDGRYLALDRPLAGWTDQRDVFVLSVDGEEEVNVTEYPSNDRVMGWSPDSSSVLFASDRSDATGLYAVPIVDGRRQGSPTLLRSALGAAAPMGVSRSGALYYHVRSGGAAWFLQSIECSGARCAGSPVTLGPVNSMGFAWSPDGGHLAYLSPGTFRAAEPTLRIRSVGGTSIREVSATELPLGGSVTMSWAPDGRTIAVGTMMGGRLSLLNVEGQRAEVTWSGRVGVTANLAWSPDQQKLYYRLDRTGPDGNSVLMERDVRSQTERELLRRQGGAAIGGWALRRDGQSIFAMVNDTAAQTSELLAIPIAGGEPQTIARRPAMGGVNVSPDGRYIATISRIASEKTTAILLIPVAGGEIRELFRVAQPAAVRDLMWTPDSQSLYFRKGPSTVGARGRGANATADTRAELWRVPIDGSEARAVEAAIDMDMRLPVALSPDGRRLAFIRSDGGGPVKSEVWKLENFLPAAAGRR